MGTNSENNNLGNQFFHFNLFFFFLIGFTSIFKRKEKKKKLILLPNYALIIFSELSPTQKQIMKDEMWAASCPPLSSLNPPHHPKKRKEKDKDNQQPIVHKFEWFALFINYWCLHFWCCRTKMLEHYNACLYLHELKKFPISIS